MSQAFDILSNELNEAIADTKTNHLSRHTRNINIEPLSFYSSEEIKNLRHQLGLTQSLFAKYFRVSPKTVAAWEAGKNQPSGPSKRLLGLIANKKVSL